MQTYQLFLRCTDENESNTWEMFNFLIICLVFYEFSSEESSALIIKFLHCYTFTNFKHGAIKMEDPHLINRIYTFQELLY